MEIVDEKIKKCFKLTHQVFRNLNIAYCVSNSITVLWNKYQIFIYDELKFYEPNKLVEPEFDIAQLVLFRNHIICLDFCGNIHTVSLNFKHPTKKIFKSNFQPREQNVLCIKSVDVDYIYSIKLVCNTYEMRLHKINPELVTEMRVKLNINMNYDIKQDNCILQTCNINEFEFGQIKNFLKIENETWNQQVLNLITFDKLTLYVLLCSNKTLSDSINAIKLYTCPSKICNFVISKLDHVSVQISLSVGTVINIPFETSEKENIVHLNSSIYKLITVNNDFLYTDGNNLWKTEKTFTDDITFKQFYLKMIKDFILIDNLIICTTFNNLVYLCRIDDENCYVKSASDDYCSADIVLNNSDCLKKIMEETDKSKEIVSKINTTKNYITTLALSTRQDVMDDLIIYNVSVYEQFDDILKENLIVSLIEDIKQYYDWNSFYFLIKISTTPLQQKFSEVLSNVFGDLKIHIFLKSNTEILKTVSMTVEGQLKKINIVIPLSITTVQNHRIHIYVKLITKMPGIFKKMEPVWAILHQTHIVLNSEHFVRTYKRNNNIVLLNSKTDLIEDLIQERALTLYEHLLKFTKISNTVPKIWSLYLKLPENYENEFRKEFYLKEKLELNKAEFIYKQIIQNQFLKEKSEICFNIRDEVKLEIISDGFSMALVKISSENLEAAFDIKQFFSNLIYSDYEKLEPGMVFVDQALYSSVENLEQTMKKWWENMKIQKLKLNDQEFFILFEQYQKIMCSLLI